MERPSGLHSRLCKCAVVRNLSSHQQLWQAGRRTLGCAAFTMSFSEASLPQKHCAAQVLLEPEENLMGSVVDVQIVSASRWSVKAKILSWLFPVHMRADSSISCGAPACSSPAPAQAAEPLSEAHHEGPLMPPETVEGSASSPSSTDRHQQPPAVLSRAKPSAAWTLGEPPTCLTDGSKSTPAAAAIVRDTCADSAAPASEQRFCLPAASSDQCHDATSGAGTGKVSDTQQQAAAGAQSVPPALFSLASQVHQMHPVKRRQIDAVDCLLYAGVLLGLAGVLVNAAWTLLFT